jgi:hypothetical protein
MGLGVPTGGDPKAMMNGTRSSEKIFSGREFVRAAKQLCEGEWIFAIPAESSALAEDTVHYYRGADLTGNLRISSHGFY